MSQKANPTVIGAFTLVGLLVGAAALVLLGAGKLFDRTHEVLLYFDRSATGLQVGSDVRFGGVRIGRVHSIRVLVDTERNQKIIPVVVSLGEKELRFVGSTTQDSGGIDFTSHEGVATAVERGLRARMMQQSLVTGQLYVEFDVVPDSAGFTYQGRNPHNRPVVPTIATEMDELFAGIAEGLEKLGDLDIEGVVEDLRELIASTNRTVQSMRSDEISENLVAISENIRRITADEAIPKAIANLEATLEEARALTQKVNEGVDPMLEDISRLVETANESLAAIEEATAGIGEASDPRSPALLRLQRVLDDAERSTRSLQDLTNELKRNPDTLLRGRINPE